MNDYVRQGPSVAPNWIDVRIAVTEIEFAVTSFQVNCVALERWGQPVMPFAPYPIGELRAGESEPGTQTGGPL